MILHLEKKPTYPPMEAKPYPAVCVGIYFIGEQETHYKNRTGFKDQIVFTFEFPTVTLEIDGEQKPRQLSRTYNYLAGEKSNLRKMLSSWIGRDVGDAGILTFDSSLYLGHSALVQVVKKDNGYNDIASVMALPEGMPDPTTQTPLREFNVNDWDDAVFQTLPEWIQARIQRSTQYKEGHTPAEAVDFPDGQLTEMPDDTRVPF
jgi:hypothetical protein